MTLLCSYLVLNTHVVRQFLWILPPKKGFFPISRMSPVKPNGFNPDFLLLLVI